MFSEEIAMRWFVLSVFIPMVSFPIQGLIQAQDSGSSAIAATNGAAAKNPSNASKTNPSANDSDESDVKTQLTVAQLLHTQGDQEKAWKVLQKLYETAPRDVGVLMGIQEVMDGYKRQGRLNVGTFEKSVLELLGPPNQTVEMPWGIRHVYGATAVDFREGKLHEQIKLQGATRELFDASHLVEADLGSTPPWQVGVRQKGDGLDTAFLFPTGESISNWTQMVTIERFVGQAKGMKLTRMLEILQEQIKSMDPNAKVIHIEQDDTTAIYAVSYPVNDDKPAHQQLVRLWIGERDVHRLAYTHQGAIPSERDGEKWLAVFRHAKLKPVDRPASATMPAVSPVNPVKKLAEDIRTDLRNAISYKPTRDALIAIAASEEDSKKLQTYCDSVYKEIEHGGVAAKPNQSEVIVFGPQLEELPGGYTSTREHFKANVNFYGFKYVAPGETKGMSFDGAFAIDGKWFFLPKAHRAFR